MDSLALLQKHLARCGIAIAQKSPTMQPINEKNSTICIVLCVDVLLNAMLLNEADTFDDYTNILFRSVSIGTCGIFYAIIIWKTAKLCEFIDSLADTIKESK